MRVKLAIYLLATVAFSLWSIKDFVAPYVWVALAWTVLLIYAAIRLKRPVVRLACFNLACAMLVLGGAEGWLQCRRPPANRHHVQTVENYVDRHDLLGYAPRPGMRTFARKHYGDELVYDVTYTFNEYGHRVSDAGEPVGAAALFFGGSFTFGAGVDDHQAMPYRAGEHAAGRYHVHNFAFSGYGPHQMLAAIEHGLVDELDIRPRVVVYQAVPHHVNRCAGLVAWDRYGPRYELGADGQTRFVGPFTHETTTSVAVDEITYQLRKSQLARRVLDRSAPVRPGDIELYLGIVDRARTLVEQRYADCEFHVLLWDYPDDPLRGPIIEGLRGRGLRVHLMSDIHPDLPRDGFRLSPHDPHPNPEAHDMIARYVAQHILRPAPMVRARQYSERATAW